MKIFSFNFSVVLLLAVAWLMSVDSTAQNPFPPQPRQTTQLKADSDIPEAALLTERGTQLAARLKWLRNAESKLGAKHPSLADIKKQIVDIKEELKAWAPGGNPFQGSDGLARKVPQMNDEDLRQLVLRLTNEITELKNRVAKLERERNR